MSYLPKEVTVPRSAPNVYAIMPTFFLVSYLPLMFSRTAFSIFAPKSTDEEFGTDRGETDIGGIAMGMASD